MFEINLEVYLYLKSTQNKLQKIKLNELARMKRRIYEIFINTFMQFLNYFH